MHVRLIEERDESEVVRLARAYACEVADVLPHVDFDEAVVRRSVFRSLTTADPTVFVADHGSGLAGMLVASIQGFYFMGGVWTSADIFYVHPDFRGTRAAALLLAEFNTWSDNLGAKVNFGGNANKLNSDRTARFQRRFGYQQAGLSMMRLKGA
ncbi:hypothetical protein XM25_00580 [Devosia sp. H5989]|nr:hypothetical protein XM25_00580 [Devosia sp. H5989]